jgi:cell division protein FtsB
MTKSAAAANPMKPQSTPSPSVAATPRTDAAVKEFEYSEAGYGGESLGWCTEIIEPDFARQLERENAALEARNAELEARAAELATVCRDQAQWIEELRGQLEVSEARNKELVGALQLLIAVIDPYPSKSAKLEPYFVEPLKRARALLLEREGV